MNNVSKFLAKHFWFIYMTLILQNTILQTKSARLGPVTDKTVFSVSLRP